MITLLQWLLLRLVDVIGVVTGQGAGAFAIVALVIGTTLTLLGLGLVQAVTACALVEIDAGRPIGIDCRLRLALPRIRPLLRSLALFVTAWVLLTLTVFLIPVAIWLAVRWCLLAPVIELEDRRAYSAPSSQRRARPSALDPGRLPRRRQRRRGSARRAAARCGADLPTNVPFAAINIVAGVVYALLLPFVAIVTAYVYFDARARGELEAAAALGAAGRDRARPGRTHDVSFARRRSILRSQS